MSPVARKYGWIIVNDDDREVHAPSCDCARCRDLDRLGYVPLWAWPNLDDPAPSIFADGALDGLVNLDGPGPIKRTDGISMDGGHEVEMSDRQGGWYRHYDATGWPPPPEQGEMRVLLDSQDQANIAYEIGRECPVTGSVVFVLSEGKIAARLVSYVAFA